MNRILKVFVTEADQDAVANAHHLVERYDAFVVVEASERAAKAIASTHLTEDITDQYTITVDGRELSTGAPLPSAKALDRAAPVAKAPDSKRHHYIVQFVGPVKDEWIAALKKAGGEVREPRSGFSYVVRANG